MENSFILRIFSPLESVLGAVGMNSPLKRFLMVFSSGFAAEYYFKPSYAFAGDLPKKPIYLDNSPGNTYTPLGFFPLIGGIIVALFI